MPSLAEIYLEQGELELAQSALEWIGAAPGPAYHYLQAQSRLLHLRGDFKNGLEAAMEAGRHFTAHGGRNPAFVPWQSQATCACRGSAIRTRLGPTCGKRSTRAREWGALWPLGRALRIAGSLSGAEGLESIREAVTLLSPSPARLEYAKALLDLGAALRRGNQRAAAREPLREAIDVATVCGAVPLVLQAQLELKTTGARRHNQVPIGRESLTPANIASPRCRRASCPGRRSRLPAAASRPP